VEIVTFAEIQKVKSSFEFKNSISSTRNCNEFRFFEPRFTSLCESCGFRFIHSFYVSILMQKILKGSLQPKLRGDSVWPFNACQ